VTAGQQAATVEVLTAEVRVLMVGSRQITLSVYRQLDTVPCRALTPFGRVHAEKQAGDPAVDGQIEVVGANRDGVLCRSWLRHYYRLDGRGWCYQDPAGNYANTDVGEADWARLEELPLIVLAGLR
jgi:hypothetical protein